MSRKEIVNTYDRSDWVDFVDKTPLPVLRVLAVQLDIKPLVMSMLTTRELRDWIVDAIIVELGEVV